MEKGTIKVVLTFEVKSNLDPGLGGLAEIQDFIEEVGEHVRSVIKNDPDFELINVEEK